MSTLTSARAAALNVMTWGNGGAQSSESAAIHRKRLSAVEVGGILAVLLPLLASLAVAAFTQTGLEAQWAALFAIATVLAVPLLRACISHQLDIFEPIHLVCAAYFLYLVASPVSDLIARREYFFGRLITPTIPVAGAYAAIGLCAMMFGYYSGALAGRFARFGPRLPSRAGREAMVASVVGVVVVLLYTGFLRSSGRSWTQLLTLGQFGRTVTATTDDQGPFRNYLYGLADSFVPIVLVLLAFGRRRRFVALAGALGLTVVFATLGFRYRILVLVTGVTVLQFLRVNRRPRLSSVTLVLVGGALALGAISDLRDSFRRGIRVRADDIDVRAAAESFGRDLDIYQPYVAVIDAFPKEHDFLWGVSFAYVALSPIPRSLWASKPEAPIQTVVRAALGDGAVEAGVTYPNIGEYYANLGVVGVIAGMLTFGFLMRLLYEYLAQQSRNEWAWVVYSMALPFLVQVVSRGYFVQIFQEACFLFVPLVLVLKLSRTRRHEGI